MTTSPKKTKLLAFFLPQYHPIPENDKWWGKGFTEWIKVAQGRPLFRDHYQPHLPADLGFYDLRVSEVRHHQAVLAREAGLDGFVYYHYWFNGRRLLERPVKEILQSKQPDFPFCLCWANESWSRNWDGMGRDVLMPQAYSEADDLAHIRSLLPAFTDERYIKIDERPLFFVYRPTDMPDARRTAELWRKEAQRHGFPDLYLCVVRSFLGEFCDPATLGFDASTEFKPNGTDCGPRLTTNDPLEIGYRIHRVWNYDDMVRESLSTALPSYRYFPGVCPSWDNSVRRKDDGIIFRNSTPEKYGSWLQSVLLREIGRPQQESLVLINAWNEWAEGNHLEPCQRWGHGYLQATRRAIDTARGHAATLAALRRGRPVTLDPSYKVDSHLDSNSRTATGLAASGWCLSLDTREPAELLLFAQRLGADTYRPLEALVEQLLPRPDLVAHTKTQASLLGGWRGRLSLGSDDCKVESIHVLAVRLRDGAATMVASL